MGRSGGSKGRSESSDVGAGGFSAAAAAGKTFYYVKKKMVEGEVGSRHEILFTFHWEGDTNSVPLPYLKVKWGCSG